MVKNLYTSVPRNWLYQFHHLIILLSVKIEKITYFSTYQKAPGLESLNLINREACEQKMSMQVVQSIRIQ